MEAFAQPTRPASSNRHPTQPNHKASHQLPHGQCHYQDISAGRNSIQCGCRQFWLNDAAQQAGAQHLAVTFPAGNWCFCGHHACYHEVEPRAAAACTGEQQAATAGTPSQQAQRTSPFQQPSPYQQAPRWDDFNASRPTSQAQDRATVPNPSGLGLFTSSNRLRFSGTSNLNQFSRNHRSANLTTAHGSAAEKSRPPSAIRAQTWSNPAAARIGHPNLRPDSGFPARPAPVYGSNDDQSATELATPSLAGTPALRDTDEAFANLRTTLEAFNRQHSASRLDAGNVSGNAPPTAGGTVAEQAVTDEERPCSPDTLAKLLRQVHALRNILSSTPNLSTSLGSLNARLEALEAQSFVHVPAEELQDRFEHFDGRMLDVEGKVTELEKQTAALMHGRSGPDGAANASFVSNASYNSGAEPGTGHIARLNAISEQLSSHHQRISDLEVLAPPSLAHPWKIEVVLLPFGAELKGLWSPLGAASTAFATQTQDSGSKSARSQSAPALPDASTMDWKATTLDTLVARACGPSRGTAGRIFERLKSRGFVQDITLQVNSASNVAAAIKSTFDERLSKQSYVAGTTAPLGLQLPFVPLKKVHKSSTLRFLNAAELASPALWTAEFLHSNVFMHAPSSSLRRLYITEPVGYLQPSDLSTPWTWSKLRELPRVKSGSPAKVGEADALEPCWAFDERLDPSPADNSSFSSGLSFHSSFDSHMLSPRQTNPPSQERQSLDGSEEERSDSVSFNFEHEDALNHDLPTSATSLSRVHTTAAPPQTLRSFSLPGHIEFSNIDATMGKRQMTSASAHPTSPLKSFPKRRRVSRSPDDVELMGLWSPRRSREPPSPRSTRLSRRASASRAASSKRASTSDLGLGGGGAQLAYATPYSHDMGGLRGLDGGSDAETPYMPSDDDDGESDDSEMAEDDAVHDNQSRVGDDADADMDSDYDQAGAADSEPEDDDAHVMRKETRALVKGDLMDSDLSQDADEDAEGPDDDDWDGVDEGSDADAEEEDHNDDHNDEDEDEELDMGPEAQAGHRHSHSNGQQGDAEAEEEDELA